MVSQGMILGHIVSSRGIEVDKFKIELISNSLTPKCAEDVRSFLGHAGFYRRFIKDFSLISHTLCGLLVKDAPFVWCEGSDTSFNRLSLN